MKKSAIGCVIGWLIALLFCLSAHAQTIENGTNGIDDDGVMDGTTPYTYTWSNSATTQDLANLSAGSYSAIVRAASSCTATSPTARLINPPPSLCPPLAVTRR